jgi:hypothetical protein
MCGQISMHVLLYEMSHGKKSTWGRLVILDAQWGAPWGLWVIRKVFGAMILRRSLGFKAFQHCKFAIKLRNCISFQYTQVHYPRSPLSLLLSRLSSYPPRPA